VLGALIAGPRHAGVGALIGAGSGAIAGAASDASRQQQARQWRKPIPIAIGQLTFNMKKGIHLPRAMSACLEGRGYTVQ